MWGVGGVVNAIENRYISNAKGIIGINQYLFKDILCCYVNPNYTYPPLGGSNPRSAADRASEKHVDDIIRNIANRACGGRHFFIDPIRKNT